MKEPEVPTFPKVIKAVMFFEFSSDADAGAALNEIERCAFRYRGLGERIYYHCAVIDRNGASHLRREILRLDPPVNLVLCLAGTPDAWDWEPAKSRS